MPGKPRLSKALPDKTSLYEIAVEEGRRALDSQFTQLDSIRQRTVQYLAFVGAATAFLVGTAMRGTQGTRPDIFLVFAGVGVLTVIISLMLTWSILTASKRWWWPVSRFKWDASVSPRLLNSWIHPEVGPKPTDADFLQALANQYDDMIETNDGILEAIRRRYRWFLGFGFIQLCVWIMLIGWFG